MAVAMTVSVVDWLKTSVPKVAQAALVQSVEREERRVITEQTQRSGGFAPDLETMVVDGKRNASLADIQATSRVILDWNYITEAVIKTVGYLRLHGPERSGFWKDSIVVLIDGHEQPVDQPIPPDTEQVIVVVTAPYSRKLEVGRTKSGRPFSIQVPQHYVEKTTIRLRSQMRDLAKFTFDYIDLVGAHVLRSPEGLHRRHWRHGHAQLGSRRKSTDSTVRYPGIIIDEIKAIK